MPTGRHRQGRPAPTSVPTNGSWTSCTSATWPTRVRWTWRGGASSPTTPRPRGRPGRPPTPRPPHRPASRGRRRRPSLAAPPPPLPPPRPTGAPRLPPPPARPPQHGPTSRPARLPGPPATSAGSVPAKLLIDNRIVVNNHLARGRGGKVSFTHLIGYAVVRALAGAPEMNYAYTEVDGKPAVARPEHVNLGLAIDVVGRDGSRQLLVPSIKAAETMDFRH